MSKDKAETQTIGPEDVVEVPAEAIAVAPPTNEEIEAQIAVALAQKDWDTVKKLSAQLAKGQGDRKRAEAEAKMAALKEITESLKGELVVLVRAKVADGSLAKADHVKFYMNLTDSTADVECSLVKSVQARTRSGAGSGKGQKHADKTDDLLVKFGHEPYKDTGMTHQEAHDSNTNGNYRFAVRLSLLKLNGNIT